MLIVSQNKKRLVFTDSGVTVYVDENILMTTTLETTLDGFTYVIGEYESEEEAQLALGYLAGKCNGKMPIAHMPKAGELMKRIAKEEK